MAVGGYWRRRLWCDDKSFSRYLRSYLICIAVSTQFAMQTNWKFARLVYFSFAIGSYISSVCMYAWGTQLSFCGSSWTLQRDEFFGWATHIWWAQKGTADKERHAQEPEIQRFSLCMPWGEMKPKIFSMLAAKVTRFHACSFAIMILVLIENLSILSNFEHESDPQLANFGQIILTRVW